MTEVWVSLNARAASLGQLAQQASSMQKLPYHVELWSLLKCGRHRNLVVTSFCTVYRHVMTVVITLLLIFTNQTNIFKYGMVTPLKTEGSRPTSVSR